MNGTETGSATLAELCDLISEQVHPADMPEALYVGLEHVTPGRLRRSGGGIAADVQSHKYAFRRNDILYGKLRPYLDKAILADTDGVCTTELLVLRAKPGVDPRFLACLVHDPDFVEHALTGVTGAHHPRTSWVHIAQFECPRFSYEEQQAIAALLWRVQDLLKVCEDTLEVAQDLKRAAMRELFTRGLRGEPQKETEIGPMPESWTLLDFREVREWLQYGTSTHCTVERRNHPVLRIPNVESGRVNPTDLKYCDLPAAESAKYLLKPGDLIFIRTNGVLERLGTCAVYQGEPDGALFASYLIRARIKANTANPKFLAYFYGSRLGTSLVAGRATPAADGKYNLNTGTIDSLPVPVPATLDEQEKIVEVLEALDRKIDLHQKKRAALEELFKSLLHKLMTGEISVSDLDLSALSPASTQHEEASA